MSYITFLTNNLVLDADVSVLSGGENNQFPLSNIKHAHTTKVFRSNSSVSELLVDLKITKPVDSFCMVGSTKSGIGVTTVTIRGSATTDFTSSNPIVIDISYDHNFGFKLFEAGSYRFWKISLTSTAGFCELSNIYLGSKTQLIDNHISLGTFTYSASDNSRITRNTYGQRFIDLGNTIMSLSGTIKYCVDSEFDTLNSIYTDHGESEPFYFILDPEAAHNITDSQFLFSGYFYFDKAFDWKSSGPGMFDVNLNLGEAT